MAASQSAMVPVVEVQAVRPLPAVVRLPTLRIP